MQSPQAVQNIPQAVVAYRLTREKFHQMNLEEHVKFAQRKISGLCGDDCGYMRVYICI